MPMTGKCKDEYQRRNYEGLAPLTKEVRQITKPILGKHGFIEIDILSSWDEIVGQDLAKGILPERISFSANSRVNGTLYVKASGGAFAMLFEHQKSRVLERINTYFGYPALSQIKIKQGALKLKSTPTTPSQHLTPDQEQDLQNKLRSISDPDLHDRLYSIGKLSLLKK